MHLQMIPTLPRPSLECPRQRNRRPSSCEPNPQSRTGSGSVRSKADLPGSIRVAHQTFLQRGLRLSGASAERGGRWRRCAVGKGTIASADTADTSGTKGTKSPRVPGRGCRIVGTGSAVPSRVLSNDFLSKVVDTNDEWIATRTGIRNRRVLSGDESLTGLSTEACRQAMAMAGVSPESIDLILFCSSSPDDLFGGACLVQRELGCSRAVAFDVTAACSGFVIGLITASRFILGGGFETVLVVGADSLSRYVDWTDRGTCILFGDASGAAVVRATKEGEEDCLLGFDIHSDGHGARHLASSVAACPPPTLLEAWSGHVPTTPSPVPSNGKPAGTNGSASHVASDGHYRSEANPSSLHSISAQAHAHTPTGTAAAAGPLAGALPVTAEQESPLGASPVAVAVATEQAPGAEAEEAEGLLQLPARAQPCPITMNGREVYKFAVTSVPKVLGSALEEASMSVDSIDWLLLHQANQRILDAVADKMGIPHEKVLSNVSNYGNTSAASVPLALDEAVRGGRVKSGDVIAMAGFGAGLTWGAAIVRFG